MAEPKQPGTGADETPAREDDYEGNPSSALGGRLDAILKIAAVGEGRDAPPLASEASVANAPEASAAAADPGWHGPIPAAVRRAANDEFADSSGVVALLAALKSDIDALRRENELFKLRMMGDARFAPVAPPRDDSHDLRQLLAILKADIEALRHENDVIRSQAFSMQSSTSAIQSVEHDLHGMLSELRADILALKKENDALRREHSIGIAPVASAHHDDVARLFAELKNDISALKHENEALRLENLVARDGARLGLNDGAYRSVGGRFAGAGRLMAAVMLVGAAAGGGYLLALSRSPQSQPQPVVMPAAPQLPAAPAVRVVETPPAAPAPAVRNENTAAAAQPALQGSVETSMLARADQLVASRDLGAARMVLVYLARKGSAEATRKLAESYDPQVLAVRSPAAVASGDIERARRLYAAAAKMGDAVAAERLAALPN